MSKKWKEIVGDQRKWPHRNAEKLQTEIKWLEGMRKLGKDVDEALVMVRENLAETLKEVVIHVSEDLLQEQISEEKNEEVDDDEQENPTPPPTHPPPSTFHPISSSAPSSEQSSVNIGPTLSTSPSLSANHQVPPGSSGNSSSPSTKLETKRKSKKSLPHLLPPPPPPSQTPPPVSLYNATTV